MLAPNHPKPPSNNRKPHLNHPKPRPKHLEFASVILSITSEQIKKRFFLLRRPVVCALHPFWNVLQKDR